jgi:hypothetical protein
MKIGLAEHITEHSIQFLDTFWHISMTLSESYIYVRRTIVMFWIGRWSAGLFAKGNFFPFSSCAALLFVSRDQCPLVSRLQKSTCTELSSIMHSLPTLEISPDIWIQTWLRSLQVNLALRWDPIMIQCTLSSREAGCMACSHAPPELPARSGRNRNIKVTRIGVLSGRFCAGRSYVWLVPEWYLIDQAN